MNELVTSESVQKDVVCVTLNRPDKRNAMNIPLLNALCSAFDNANASNARVIIVRGAGPVFCSGLDLTEANDPSKSHESAGCIARMIETILQSRAATIAAVHGAAVAGGAGLMTACDFAVAEAGTKIGYPEVRRGLVAGLVMTLLRRQVRERDARELLLLGETIDAHRAREMGLLNRVVPGGTATDAALELTQILLKGGPHAIARTKQVFADLWPRAIESDLAWALNQHRAVRTSREAHEGINAFNEKRKPSWETGE
ncbi:MAG TPA: enoyl-CoA hydratase-related protein [Candidatus Hydrogenedentes bacterium]|nr:enoyl-CoA hydratase-related protein [Candidatus Hydrogenedentota bacterium]